MERNLLVTEDGSHTLTIPELKTSYHSIHGAVQESRHVFIRAGLEYFLSISDKKEVHIFEIGFGTGLNALLTSEFAKQQNIFVRYRGTELFPLNKEEYEPLNYREILGIPADKEFLRMHHCEWEKDEIINANFTLHKTNASLLEMPLEKGIDLLFFDAFDASIQPELWTPAVFTSLYACMNEYGIFVTYSSKGDVRRALTAAGFSAEKIPSPPGKREMIRAVKKTRTSNTERS